MESRSGVADAHLCKLRHELDVGNDIRQHSTAIRVNNAIGRISQAVKGLLEPVVLLESAWIVWIGLLHGAAGVRTPGAVRGTRAGPVLVRNRHANTDTDGDDSQKTNKSADDLLE